jgi:hypothetical protein
MSTYDETLHPRGKNPANVGQYSAKDHAEPEGVELDVATSLRQEVLDSTRRYYESAIRTLCDLQEAGWAHAARAIDPKAKELVYHLDHYDNGNYYDLPSAEGGSGIDLADVDLPESLTSNLVPDADRFRAAHQGRQHSTGENTGTIRADIDEIIRRHPTPPTTQNLNQARDTVDRTRLSFEDRQEDNDRALDQALIDRVKANYPAATALQLTLECDGEESNAQYVTAIAPIDEDGNRLDDDLDDTMSTTNADEIRLLYGQDSDGHGNYRLVDTDDALIFRFTPSGPPVKHYKGRSAAMDAEVIRKLKHVDDTTDVDALASEWIVHDPATGKYRARYDNGGLFHHYAQTLAYPRSQTREGDAR